MKFCSKCGNQLLDQAVLCPKCGCMVEGAMPIQSIVNRKTPHANPSPRHYQSAPIQQRPPVQQSAHVQQYVPVQQSTPVYQAPPVQQPAPVKEQAAPTAQPSPVQQPEPVTHQRPVSQPSSVKQTAATEPPAEYKAFTNVVKNALITNIISIVLLVASGIVWYFFSIYGGACVALAAELVALIPNTRLKLMFKRCGFGAAQKAQSKTIKKQLKRSCTGFTVSYIIAIIALVIMILFLFSPEIISAIL